MLKWFKLKESDKMRENRCPRPSPPLEKLEKTLNAGVEWEYQKSPLLSSKQLKPGKTMIDLSTKHLSRM